jgi:hypothetical protein
MWSTQLTSDYTDLDIMPFGMIYERPRERSLKLDAHRDYLHSAPLGCKVRFRVDAGEAKIGPRVRRERSVNGCGLIMPRNREGQPRTGKTGRGTDRTANLRVERLIGELFNHGLRG